MKPYIQARVGGRVDAWDESGTYTRCDAVSCPIHQHGWRTAYICVTIEGRKFLTSSKNIIYLVELEVAS